MRTHAVRAVVRDLLTTRRKTKENSAPMYQPDRMLWEDVIPGGCHWSGVLKRGQALRLVDERGSANVAALFYNQAEKVERYNMADTLKAQHTSHLTRGFVCY